MSISTEDLANGQEANTRIKNYGKKRKPWISLIIAATWLASSISLYEAKADSAHLIELGFWSAALIWTIIFEYRRKKTYLHDLATLEKLKKLYGFDISFGEENTSTNADGKAIKERDDRRNLETLIVFCILLAVALTFTYFIKPLIFSHH